jgi:predicted nucleic acid-binding protein
MILVDSSVWIAHLRGEQTQSTEKLEAVSEPLLLGDLIVLEILQGAREDVHAVRIEAPLRRFAVFQLLDADLAVRAASNFRFLRSLGITIRKTVDLIIGTYCIAHGHPLLHDNRDFEPMQRHLGLRVA